MDAASLPDPFLTHTDEQSLLRESCREVLDREMPSAWVRERLESQAGWDASRWKVIRELGWPGVAIAEAFGGVGLGLVELGVLAEEFGRVVHSGPFLASSAVALALGRWGEAELQASWLPRLADGSAIGSWSVDVDGSCGAVVAERASEDPRRLVLRGARHFVPAAAEADLLLLDVVVDGCPTLALVSGDEPGLTFRRMTTIDLARSYFAIELDGIEIDSAALLGGNDALAARRYLADVGMAIQCAESVGAARRLLEMTVEYAKQRRQFDRPIGSFQAIKHRLADMRVRLESSTVASRYVTWAVAEDRPDAPRAVHVAKQFVGESCSWLASEALQLHGGVGFTWEHDLHLYLRRLKANELTLGSPDWHSLELGCWCLEHAAD